MATPYQDRPLTAPAVSPENKLYFDAAGQGKLMVKRCVDCGEHHHYPRSLCPFCFSDKVEWTEASGLGTVYTFSVTRKAGPIPYVIAYVTLDGSGVTMMSNIVDCDLDTVHIGQRVKVVFKPSEGGAAVPMFTPTSA